MSNYIPLILLGAISPLIGFCLGLVLRETWKVTDYKKVYYLGFPGRILLNILQMLTFPHVISYPFAIVTTIGSLDIGTLCLLACVYYVLTTLLAIAVGVCLVCLTFQSNLTISSTKLDIRLKDGHEQASILFELMTHFFPDNLVLASFEKTTTDLLTEHCDVKQNSTEYICTWQYTTHTTQKGTNVIGLIMFSIMMGCVINHLGKEGQPLKRLFKCLDSIMTHIFKVTSWLISLGTISLIAHFVVSSDDLENELRQVAVFVRLVILGFAIHGLLVLPLIYVVCTRRNPFKLALHVCRGLCTAWTTASSTTALSMTTDDLVNKCDLDGYLVDVVLSMGCMVNKDGTALYVAVACIFIAIHHTFGLSIADIIFVSIASMVAGLTAPGISQSGVISLVVVMTALGLPVEQISIVLLVHWILDHFKSPLNLWGDCVGAGILDHYFKDLLLENESRDIQLEELKSQLSVIASASPEKQISAASSAGSIND